MLCSNRIVGAGFGPMGAFWLRVQGWSTYHLLAGKGVALGLGLGSCRSSDCNVSCSLALGFGCCCGWRFSGSPSCVVPACCETSRPLPSCLAVSSLLSFLTSWAAATSHTVGLASTSAVKSMMPVPHITLSLWHSSHFVSVSSSHSFMPSHRASSHAYSRASSCAVWASSILATLSTVWCSWVASCTCCLIVRSIRHLQSPGAVSSSEVFFLSLFPFLLRSHCSLADTKDTRVVISDLWPATLLASPASAMFLYLSNEGFSNHPPITLLPCWVAIMAGLFDVALLCQIALFRPLSIVQGGWKSFASVCWMGGMECCCSYVALCQGCWVIWKLLLSIIAKRFGSSTQLRGFLCMFFFADVLTLLR